MYGKNFSDEHRRKLSESLRGENNPFHGKKHSEETKQKMRKPKPRFNCQFCNKEVGGEGNLKKHEKVCSGNTH